MNLRRRRTAIGVLCLVVILILWLGSVRTLPGESTPSADEFLASDDCAAPCWRGIKPGKSRSADVFRTLAQDKAIRSPSEQPLQRTYPEERLSDAYLITWIGPRTGMIDQIIIRNDTVELVEISNYSHLSLGETLQRFGPPDHILLYGPEIETGRWHFIGYWPDQGIVTQAYVPSGKQVKLDPAIRIRSLTYFEPTSEELMWQIPRVPRYFGMWCTQEYSVPWPGWVEVSPLNTDLLTPPCRQ